MTRPSLRAPIELRPRDAALGAPRCPVWSDAVAPPNLRPTRRLRRPGWDTPPPALPRRPEAAPERRARTRRATS